MRGQTYPEARATLLRTVRRARAAPMSPDDLDRGPGGVPRARGARHVQRAAPRARSATSRRRRWRCRSPARCWRSGSTRASTSGTRARSARSWRRRSPDGSATWSGFRRGRLGGAHLGRGHGQPHGDDPRARRLARRSSAGSPGRRAAATWRACASTPATRRTSRSRGRSTCSASRDGTLRVVPSDERFRLHAGPVDDAIARGPRGRADAARDRRRRRLHEHRVGRRRAGPGGGGGARVAVAPRRRRLRRGRAAVSARRAPRAGTRAGRHRHGRPAQVVLPGLRHRRADRAPARGPARRPSIGRPSTTVRIAPRTSRCIGTSTRWRGRGGSAR